MKSQRSLFAVFVCVLVFATVGIAPALAACTINGSVDITCDGANDSFATNSAFSASFSGGAGNDSLTIQAGGIVGNNSTDAADGFFGDLGADSLINNGTITAADGMQDGSGAADDGFTDVLINNGLITAVGSGIEGGDLDILSNDGTIVAGFYGLDCYSDVGGGCYMANSGSISAGGFGARAEDGNDTLLNSVGGSINSDVSMGGGNDLILATGGQINGLIELGSGNDTLYNAASIGSIDGGSGNDSLYNGSDGVVAGNVNMGLNNDMVNNFGQIIGAVTLSDGADSLFNFGVNAQPSNHAQITGTVYGDAGNDTIANSLNGYILNIDGGAGNDSLRNHSIVAGVLDGGVDNDTVTNFAGALATSVLGGTGNDSLGNGGALNNQLNGSAGNDTITNYAGAVASWMYGGNDDDRIVNGGFINADLNGGHGQDSIVNLGGAFASHIYGDLGFDTLSNAGFLNGSIDGGDADDSITNFGGAQAGVLNGSFGNDYVFNGGYLVGQLIGATGNDNLINAAYAYAGGVDLGSENDTFVNGGYVNGNILCGTGNDTISLGGYVAGGLDCGDGSDIVALIGGVVAGVLDGGAGVDGLSFAFTVTVNNPNEAQAISAALAAASPAGGSIVIGGVTYTWQNFEALYNLISFIGMAEPLMISFETSWRINAGDSAAPVAVYCADSGVELWTVSVDGQGTFAVSVPYGDVNAGTTVSASGVTFTSISGGAFTVSATALDGKAYAFSGSCG